MSQNQLYYGGIIPGEFIETWYMAMANWMDQYLDNQMAREMLAYRGVAPTTEEYGFNRYDVTGDEVVPKAKSTAGGNFNMAGRDTRYKIYRWPTGFILSEDDLAKDATLQNIHVEAGLAKIFRAEDKAFYAGRADVSITGMKDSAEANSYGGCVGSADNGGAWLSDDGKRDIYQDVVTTRACVLPRFRNDLKSLHFIANVTTADAFMQKDPYSDSSAIIADSVGKIFGRMPGDMSWLFINDQVADNYGFVMPKNPLVGELVEAQEVLIDDNYPRQPINNLQIIMYEDMGIAIHDNRGIAEIDVS
jgi:hypothetical protein